MVTASRTCRCGSGRRSGCGSGFLPRRSSCVMLLRAYWRPHASAGGKVGRRALMKGVVDGVQGKGGLGQRVRGEGLSGTGSGRPAAACADSVSNSRREHRTMEPCVHSNSNPCAHPHVGQHWDVSST
eukprot:355782-Chlamydomonas_euryale.AAC.10